MKKNKVVCIHPQISNITSMVDYLKIKENQIVNTLFWDAENPDYVIATEHIYSKKIYFDQFCKYYKTGKNRVFILHCGESNSPDLNIFDYAIVYDRQLNDLDRIVRLSPQCFYEQPFFETENTISLNEAKKMHTNKKFCDFIYSNPNAYPTRDELFYTLSKYKKVDSLGAHLNNTHVKSSRRNENWMELSVKMKENYKFTIAAENEKYEGYITEKLLTSFQAHSIPIYWGNPYIAEEYNPKAFINCHDYNTLEEVVEKVKEIDQNNELWAEMISQPWQTKDQKEKTKKEIDHYQAFICNIFTQDILMAQRRPMGTWSDNYFRWFSRPFKSNSLARKILKKLECLFRETTFKLKSGL